MNIKSRSENKVKSDDILIILFWVKSFFSFENKSFNYQNLIDQAITYQITNTQFDVSIHPIDDLMIDAYKIYHKLKNTEDQFSNVLNTVNVPFIKKDMIIDQIKTFTSVFEYFIENCYYEDPEIRGIQRGILTEKMKKYVADEDYEKAAKVRDIINEY